MQKEFLIETRAVADEKGHLLNLKYTDLAGWSASCRNALMSPQCGDYRRMSPLRE